MTDSVESSAASPSATTALMRPEKVRLDSVVTHPANPRKNLGDLSDLEASIREVGVIQPPVVLPATRVAAAWPAHAEALAGARWVVLVGARRRVAAGRVYGDDPEATLGVLVREDAIADDALGQLDVMTAENVARAPLSPVEEARAFAEQEAAGRRQRDIAATVGCSQSHVSKRLKLLRLPDELLAELETGRTTDGGDDQEHGGGRDETRPALQIRDALALVDAAGDDQELMLAVYRLRDGRRRDRTAVQMVAQVRREREQQRAADAAREKLAADGTPVIGGAMQKFGDSYWQHRLDGAKAIEAARRAGALVAEVNSRGQVSYYSTATPTSLAGSAASEAGGSAADVGDVLGYADGDTCHGTDQVASAAGPAVVLALMDYGDGNDQWSGGRYIAVATTPGRWNPVTNTETLDTAGGHRRSGSYAAPHLAPAEAETAARLLNELADLAESGHRPPAPTKWRRAAQRLKHLIDGDAGLAREKVAIGDEELPVTLRDLLALLHDKQPTTGPVTGRHVTTTAVGQAGGDTGTLWLDLVDHDDTARVAITGLESDEDPGSDYWQPYTAYHTPAQARELAAKLRAFARASASRPGHGTRACRFSSRINST
ncbi:ParB/RepB/Spo0J family partition protein [Streptomyces rochei]|uniref:ParB/RepB/Spo0J family partition protein n=1 Tax=Streptomyces rochei TaxID=1928 RepID=UPI00379A74D5